MTFEKESLSCTIIITTLSHRASRPSSPPPPPPPPSPPPRRWATLLGLRRLFRGSWEDWGGLLGGFLGLRRLEA